MPIAERPHLATFSAGTPFLDRLAGLVLDLAGGDPVSVARTLVLLPNRRSAVGLRDAFVQRAGAGMLLPRMLAVADLAESGLVPPGNTGPAAITPEAALLALAGILTRSDTPATQTMPEAAGLLAALEELAAWDCSPDDLERLDLEAPLAEHWLKTLTRLHAVLAHWPGILDAQGLITPMQARVAAARALAARWRADPDAAGRVIAAGFLAAPPHIADLLAVIARLPDGLVILPGLDLDLDEAQWHAIAPGGLHPQAPLRRLLEAIGVARGEVAWLDSPDSPPLRARALAGRLAEGHAAAPVPCLEAATVEEEAAVIALRLRRAVEDGQFAALVTPDRDLAGRVIARLRRWGIRADDSAGRPLGNTAAGALARLAMAVAAQGSAAAVLELLEHPLVAAGEGRGAWLASLREVDRIARTGAGERPRPYSASDLRAALPDTLASWLDAALERLEPLGLPGPADLGRWATALTEALGRLADEALWQEEDGRALRDMLEGLMAGGASLGPLGGPEAATVLDQALALVTVRPAPGQSDPRVAIRGLIEARLQSADVLVLGGLNEGVWPGAPAPDPWLAPFARRALGLPDEATRIALAAHDLGMLIESRADLLLTRARRDAAGPTVPSRFWLRLEAAGLLRPAEDWLAWARALDLTQDLPRPAVRPAPRPPAQLRPRRISTSRLDTLRADPFAIFAADILGLRRLPWLDEPLGAAERGTAIHAVLSRWLVAGAPAGTLAGALGEALGRWLGADPARLALERPRLARAADWVEGELARRRAQGWRFAASEESVVMPLIGEVQLRGRADWVEVHSDGGLAVIDFKTGTPPSATMLRAGFATQLGLLGALLEDRAGQGSRVAELAYWRLGGGLKDPVEIRDILRIRKAEDRRTAQWDSAGDFITFCLAQAVKTARRYLLGDEPFTAKARPDFARMGDDFDHLARVDEWIADLGRPIADGPAA